MQLLTLLVTKILHWKGLLKGNICTLRWYVWMPLLTLLVTETLHWKGFVKRQQLHTPTVHLDATVNPISN